MALIGSGRMGAFHGETIARRVPGAQLVVVADPEPGAADALASRLGAAATTDPAAVLADRGVDAVVIAAPARFHADLVVAATTSGTHVFCEKPMAMEVADAVRASEAARAAGIVLQVGFNRRFAADWRAARALIDAGGLGAARTIRSLTRDPGGFDPARVAPGTIFRETLIHDLDTLRFLNPGATAVEVYATADALVRPDWRDRGLLDTAVLTVRFDNGATGIAEACFQAAHGYDVRAEWFGPGGMLSMGSTRADGLVVHGAAGLSAATVRYDQDLFRDAYTAELTAFVDAVASGADPALTGGRPGGLPGGDDAAAALAIALAAAESVREGSPVRVPAVPSVGVPA
ncbi:Gfo/Idh/MocA family oxidoreductase [Pseudonocardia sp. N23]|uniref:Gfo/Idh/MocA family oxidoreductase n=1 Tax=Pseudonocardia sp. N23 TaxID=1987376 RepID=UPI000C023AC3|nr:Gfo/Idh/MocA family oxidoreductase [Pseudonocardia sp. N23]GAY08151.1 myo-inositol 2-dehydrogenase [Pseudonocardia sp. N23]